MLDQVLEGTWEEITQHADELAGKHVRVTVLEEASDELPNAPQTSNALDAEPPAAKSQPNEAMLQVIAQVTQMQAGMRYTSGTDTQRLLREARAGAMYGYDPCE
jgi:alkylation response protein AidB-like acyl-CoA dehydrogenase